MTADLWAWLNINFMSHGHCYLWRPDLVLLHVLSDTMIALAYYSIPFALWSLRRQRPDLEHGKILTLFAIFIFACGTTHVVNIWNIWHGHYYFSGAVKLLTAVASVFTAVLIWPLIPKLAALPRPSELTASNEKLKEEIVRRKQSEQELLKTQEALTQKIEELTKAREDLVVENQQRQGLEKLLEQQNTTLRRSNEELDQFASVAAHDLREPLRKIQSFSQLLCSGRYGAFNDQGEKFINSIESATNRMEAMLRSLLHYSRVGSEALNHERVNLCELIDDVKTDLSLSITEANARVECESQGNFAGDLTQLRQLLQNLLSNSLKYRRSDVLPVIRVSGMPRGDGSFCIEVSDNGIGFDIDQSEKIFDLFHRLHGRSEYSGSGVGLAVCRKIVMRHGGQITVDSAIGAGSTFTIILPSETGSATQGLDGSPYTAFS